MIKPFSIGGKVATEFICKDNIEINFDENIIRVCIYTWENESNEEFYSQFRRTRYFVYALDNYSWQVGNKSYIFKRDMLSTKDLLNGMLTKDNYDVMIYPPDMVDKKMVQSISKYQIQNVLERNYIQRFIKSGGGFLGTCAGGVIANIDTANSGGLYNNFYSSLDLDISDVSVVLSDESLPLIGELLGKSPNSVGPGGAYLWYSGWNQSNYSVNFHTGVCLDTLIHKDNPIFDDYQEDTRKIRWIGGPAYSIPEKSNRTIYTLSSFPEEEMSDNLSTRIHYWDYTDGFKGLLKGLFLNGDFYYFTQFGPLLNIYVFANDWEMLEDNPVKTNYSNKPFMTAEIFPNENSSRIIRCTGHLEHNVWWGGYIQEKLDNSCNNQYEGFYRWKDVIPEEETIENEFSYNYWIIRRCIAWASKKMPDSHLPPTYGPSEVCEPSSYNTSLKFELIGSTEPADGKMFLDLYYRYSPDNQTWSEWTFHSTDEDESDGWSWSFDAEQLEGAGFYEFYSIRRVGYFDDEIVEGVPSGPDVKICNINNS